MVQPIGAGNFKGATELALGTKRVNAQEEITYICIHIYYLEFYLY